MKRESTLIWLVIAGLTICNIILVIQNIKLREIVEQQYREKRVEIDDNFNDLKVFDAGKKYVDIISGKSIKKVILFSSSSCSFCRKQNPLWIRLLNQSDSENYEFFMLFNNGEDDSKVNEYLKSSVYLNIKKPIKFLFSDDETLRKYKLSGTPATIVINENGFVEKSWLGLWDQMKISEVESYFQVTLE